MTIISAIILLGILIFVHELGHFMFAKLLGVKVLRFSIGFGKKLIGKTYMGTEYLISAFPLGGYVKMLGQDTGESEEEGKPLSEEDRRRAFNVQPVWKRFLIVLAGPVFNILFAVVVFSFIFVKGVPVLLPDIGEVIKGSPAEAVGLAEGDRIVEIDGAKIEDWGSMTSIIHGSAGKKLHFKIQRGEEIFEVDIAPERSQVENIFSEEQEVGLIGIAPSGDTFIERYPLHRSILLGFERTADVVILTVVAVVKLIQRILPAGSIGGPIMIVQMAGERASEGAMNFFMFMAVISINLGIINLFPIPILDGGHLVFLSYEGVMRRPPSERTVSLAQRVGLILIIMLMAFAIYNDIIRLITGAEIP